MAKFFIVLNILFFIGSCSTPRPKGKTEAEVLYQESEKLMKAGRYILATEKLNRIRSKYPYSYYATFAELLAADVLFLQENYAEAAAAYIVFKDFHPKHKKADYVVYRIGESFFKQLPSTFDRDLSPGFEAIKYYRELKKVHETSEYAKKADGRIQEIEGMIRNKEKYIADFYFKTEVYDAARFRYENIINEFREPDIRAHAMIRSFEASEYLGEPDYCNKNKDLYTNMVTQEFKKDLNKALADCLKAEVKPKEEKI
ncbi:MAG: outer membrane protein assembly factor BamD [Halobacteriovoraceae bacterium]|jgi:outer membrane protein assembly factor BamD|nr:outer membrane protein assembly factor BamD [Halobacteriovoraceae bacterium]